MSVGIIDHSGTHRRIRHLRTAVYFFINQPHMMKQCTQEASRILSQLSSRLVESDPFLQLQAVDQVRNANTDGYESFTRERITTILNALERRYKELVAKDPHNAIVGPVDEFYRPINIQDYSALINTQVTDMGIETQECLLNLSEYKRHVLHKIQALVANKRLTILTEHDVKEVKTTKVGQSSYRITAVNANNQTVKMYADAVINCTWHNVEWVARSIPSPPASTPMTSRVKILCRVSLPPLLITAPSMFFGIGAHCMFSNLGDGTGLMTYAPVTNVFNSQEQQLPAEWLHRIRYGLSSAEKDIYGEAIIDGVSFYIPAMRKCQLLDCAVGVVKTQGSVDIYDSSSSHHARDEYGVECIYPGFVNNAAMKLLYAHSNAHRAVERLAPIFSS
jgi:hypothetical protein